MTQRALDLSPRFFFDLGSPDCWLAAEQVGRFFGQQAVWWPTSETLLRRESGTADWGSGPLREIGMSRIEERASTLGLGVVQWPYPWPNESCRPMRVAAYAETVARCQAFASAAFRLQFLEGERLSDWHVIATAVHRAKLPGRAALDAPLTELFKQRLRQLTSAAVELGVATVPAISVAGQVFHGEELVCEAHDHWHALRAGSVSSDPA